MRWVLSAIATIPVITAIAVNTQFLTKHASLILLAAGIQIIVSTILAMLVATAVIALFGNQKKRTFQKAIMISMLPITTGTILLSARTYL